jgi:Macrocin-O-methyltransferase (TylF)
MPRYAEVRSTQIRALGVNYTGFSEELDRGGTLPFCHRRTWAKVMSLRTLAQVALTKIGACCSPFDIHNLNAAVNYLGVGCWLKANGFHSSPRYATRELLYSAIATRIAHERVLYLEFGVYQGDSMRSWSRLLANPQSLLHGFDSFEGLPEAWDIERPKGTFSMDGRLPEFEDARIQLHRGWFEQTLPLFAIPDHERLVVNMDADLYSSTKFVLNMLRQRIARGTIIIFDEFCDRQHELRAFHEFLHETEMTFRFIGATQNLEQVGFERTE